MRPLARPFYRCSCLLVKLPIANVSVCVYPLVLLPGVYRYGYAMPFYNVQQTIRSLIFGTRNQSAWVFSASYSPDGSAENLIWIVVNLRSGAQFWSADRMDNPLVVYASLVPTLHATSRGSRAQSGNCFCCC